MNNSKQVYLVVVCLLSYIVSASAMSQCSLKVPVPDLTYCDATGTLEEHIDADVHETRGRVKAVQDYQHDSFKLFDQQLNTIVEDSTTDMDILDVVEEIQTLKRFVTSLSEQQELPEISDKRQKRAAPSTPNQTQQLLNSAQATFQKNLASIKQKLASISSSIAKDAAQSSAIHTKLLQDLAKNQQSLTATEQQLQTLDTAVRNALTSTGTGVSGVSLSTVTQEVTDLVINATVSEQIIQRQLDDLEKLDKQLEASEQVTTSRLGTLTTDLNDLDKRLTNATQQTAVLKGGEHIYEDRVGTFISNTTRDVANLRAELASAQQSVSQVGRSAFNTTMAVGQFEIKLTAFRKDVDGIQSAVTFSQPLQQSQIGQILKLKKTLADDINVLKYAFGLTKTPP
ncbi:uncharacterized protein LOC123565722 [Mercenaria mercenaria]|uniref:uncharacterized protein LOC123565722 n=1 Tax=Mercenaria mercenaria TaxID=6596 RepID=UPI00234E8758|nr:uncharacterized protein LOC123565722 [Mercenaria mercenaria]